MVNNIERCFISSIRSQFWWIEATEVQHDLDCEGWTKSTNQMPVIGFVFPAMDELGAVHIFIVVLLEGPILLKIVPLHPFCIQEMGTANVPWGRFECLECMNYCSNYSHSLIAWSSSLKLQW